MAVGANLPKLAVGAGLFGDRLEKPWHGFGAIYATLVIPISDWWGGSHAIKRSKLNHQIAKNTNLRLNEGYFKAGTVTVTDLLKAQTLFRQAKDQYVDAGGLYKIEEIK